MNKPSNVNIDTVFKLLNTIKEDANIQIEIIKNLKEEKSSLSKERNRLEGIIAQLESKLKTI